MKDKNYKFIILDKETGGLSPKKNPITQAAMIAIDSVTFKEVNRFETYIKPYNNLVIEKKALQHTGLTIQEINKGIEVKQYVQFFSAFCKEISPKNDKFKRHKPVLVGHNILFDIGFLKEAYRICNKELDCVAGSEYGEIEYIDTLRLARIYWKNEGKMNLTACCERAGIKLSDAHKAMNDVEATSKLFQFLMNNKKSGTIGKEKVEESEVDKFRKTFQF